ncbi:hypothetical protein FE257_005037 [Aspergillus nanangensis]|uniref:Alpha/beta hydrolase n=1 Tax=Aspergillus nanangensis TaxID=2582783 RepID=A0AAD4GVS7_ASPNN|nr:hypothetical protein FE257_005037 [Aspergillus nanangensis]
MKWTSVLSILAIIIGNTNVAMGQGSGPYPASWFEEPSLANHTIYMPESPPDNMSLPVLVWGNGACENNGIRFMNLLTNIASYGFIVLASGPPEGTGSTNVQMLRDSVSWALESAGSEGKYLTVDASKIAVAGQSCGGLEAYHLRDDDRVSFLGIFNSGFLPQDPGGGLGVSVPWEDPTTIEEVHKPVFYFLGGPSDIAYTNGRDDYEGLTGVPKWMGNYPVGHFGTYSEPDGGAFGVAAVHWLLWTLSKRMDGAEFFTDGGAEAAGWETESHGLESLLQ